MLNKNLFYAIQLEKAVIAIILTVIVMVAAFNVVSTLMMMIHDKTKEIAILKAMGFRPMPGLWAFLHDRCRNGSRGNGLGVLFGLGLNWILEHTQLIRLAFGYLLHWIFAGRGSLEGNRPDRGGRGGCISFLCDTLSGMESGPALPAGWAEI